MAEDPVARAVPYMLSGGTDAKSFDDLGIRCFGFAPLRLPPELDFAGMFHGVDERVPVDGLKFGVRVLDRFIDTLLTHVGPGVPVPVVRPFAGTGEGPDAFVALFLLLVTTVWSAGWDRTVHKEE